MTMRTIALVSALALTGLGLAWTLADLLRPAPPVATVSGAVARVQIPPYTYITQDMVAAGPELTLAAARERGAWALADVVGKMSTDLIAPGDTLGAANALPAQTVRYVADLGLEVVSFQATVDRLVAGQVRTGSLVNLYGTGRDAENRPFTTLIEPRLWVVAVSAGGQAVQDGPVDTVAEAGAAPAPGERDRPATLVTVAAAPDVAYHVIDSLGAQGLRAWVTLAADRLAQAPTRGPATATPDLAPLLVDPRLRATVGPTPGDTGWGWGANH